MGSKWQALKVSEFADVVGGGTPTTKIEQYWNGSIPWLTPKDLSSHQGRYISKGERNISKEGLKNSSAHILPAKAVLLTSRAPVGYVAIAENEICTNQGFRNLVVKDGFDSEFVYYLLSHNTEYLKQHASGSTFQELSGGTLKELEFQIPPFSEQRAIAHILGSLDDKIELNRKMNEMLEAMARAIFKSWFVDFDPVRAKAEGRDPGLPKEIADLFPDSFEDSELGQIPKGWEVGLVSDLGNVICGKTPPTKDPENYGEDIPFITIPDMHGKIFVTQTGKYLSTKGANIQPNKYLPAQSICVSCIATTGLVVMTTERSQTNQQINSVIPNNEHSSYYCYQVLNRLGDQIRAGGSGGSVLLNLNKTLFSNIKILAPDSKTIEGYQRIVEPFYERVLQNQRESASLSSLRDTLLPKLISRELCVQDAEKFFEEVGL